MFISKSLSKSILLLLFFIIGQDTDILTDEERSRGKMPALAPKDVSAAVLYSIAVRDGVQVINSSISPSW